MPLGRMLIYIYLYVVTCLDCATDWKHDSGLCYKWFQVKKILKKYKNILLVASTALVQIYMCSLRMVKIKKSLIFLKHVFDVILFSDEF